MSTIRRILVFGVPGIKQLRFDNNEMSFADIEFSDHLASYDIAIYCTGAFKYKHQKGFLGQNFVNPIPPQQRFVERMKSILWLGNNNLVSATNEFLESLGFQTFIDEIYEEDL